MFNISASEFGYWKQLPVPKGLRTGQFFYTYFKLEKLSGERRVVADKIYELDGNAAIKEIESLLDYQQ